MYINKWSVNLIEAVNSRYRCALHVSAGELNTQLHLSTVNYQ